MGPSLPADLANKRISITLLHAGGRSPGEFPLISRSTSAFRHNDKPKPKPSNNNSTACRSILKLRGGYGKKNISFVMTATVERSYVGQVLIDFESKSGVQFLIRLSSRLLIDWLATTSTRCCSLKSLSEVDVRWSLWIDP